MLIRTRSLVALGITFGLGLACSGKTLPYPGGIMLAVQTDLAAPKDVAAVGLFITSDGRPIFGDTRDVAPNGEVKFPATIAILADAERPRAVVKIRAVAFKANGDVRVLRDIITTVPKGRTGLLRAPLRWLNEGSGTGSRDLLITATDGFERLVSACPEGQTFLEGECGDARVDGDALPEYAEKEVFGGGDAQGNGGRCFDVATCFAAPRDVPLDLATCSANIPSVSPDDPSLSLAVALAPSADAGECFGGTCLVPLDKGSGWNARGAAIEITRAVCRKIQEGRALRVVATTACPAKDATTPSCGPASAVASPGPPVPTDGGGTTPTDPDFEVPFPAQRQEPLLADIALDQQNVYLSRGRPDMPAAILRIKKSDLTGRVQPEDFQILHSFPNGQETKAKLALATGAVAPRIIARTDAAIFLCPPNATGSCPAVTVTGPRNALAAANVETYFYGAPSATEDLHAIQHAQTFPEPRIGPGVRVVSLDAPGSSILLGAENGAIYSCTIPCMVGPEMSVLRPAPASAVIITAVKVSDKVPGKIFFIAVPTLGSNPPVGGVFEIGSNGMGEVQLATGFELAGGTEAPVGLAVDARYVYWSGVFLDPRDNSMKAGVMRRNHVTRAPAEPMLEPNQAFDQVSAIAVDDTHLFWTYYRQDRSLFMARKKGSF